MRLKSAAFVVVLACVTVLLGAYGLSAIAAETQTDYNFPPVIQKLIEKFNLDPAKVDEVLQQDRKEKEAKREAMVEERLEQAVEQGKITEKQKEAIIAKKSEIQEKLEALRDLSAEERCEAMKQLREETATWAEENGIDQRLLMFGGRRGPGHGGFMCGPKGMGGGLFGPPPSGVEQPST